MTVMGDANYGQYMITEFEPDWVRRERYDYCDGFRMTLRGNGRSFIANISSKIKAIFA